MYFSCEERNLLMCSSARNVWFGLDFFTKLETFKVLDYLLQMDLNQQNL